jgi:hypothetical protein
MLLTAGAAQAALAVKYRVPAKPIRMPARMRLKASITTPVVRSGLLPGAFLQSSFRARVEIPPFLLSKVLGKTRHSGDVE